MSRNIIFVLKLNVMLLFEIRKDCGLTIKTTSLTPPSVTKLYLYVCIGHYMFRFLANHLQKAHQHCKGNYHYMIHKYIKLVPSNLMFLCIM
jgi:hypothetical protein